MPLHIPTLFAVIMLTACTMAIAMAAVANRQHLDLRPWAAGTGLQVLAYGLFSLRGQIPDVLSIVLGNLCLTGTMALYAVGLLRFHGQPVRPGVYAWPLGLAAVGFTVWMHQFETRLLFGSALLLAQNAYNLWLLLKFRHRAGGRGQYLLMAGGGLIALVMAWRIGALLTGWGQPQAMTQATAPQVGAFVATLVSTLLLGVGILVMSRERAESALATSEAHYRRLVDAAGEGICVLEGGLIRFVNPMVCSMLGRGAEQLVGVPFIDLVHADDRETALAVHRQRLKGEQDHRDLTLRLLAVGGPRWFNVNGVAFDWQGRPATLNFLNDVTERRVQEDRIRDFAFHDTLTHLPNRRLFMDQLAVAKAMGNRSGLHAAVVFVDLDNFKPLNDAHGHAVGDLLLIEVAQRLVGGVRVVDTAARLGGDEFVLLLTGLDANGETARQQALQVANKLLASLSAPYRLQVLGGVDSRVVEHRCSASVGVALLPPGPGCTVESALAAADAAMYQAKQTGRNRVCVGDCQPE